MLQHVVFMYKVKNKLISSIFQQHFSLNKKHKYDTRSSAKNFCKPIKKSKVSQFFISFRGPYPWKKVTTEKCRKVSSINQIKQTKKLLLSSNNDENCF